MLDFLEFTTAMLDFHYQGERTEAERNVELKSSQ
jgi:hypothetical protein